MRCRICHNNSLEGFLSLGATPLANQFLDLDEIDKKEQTFPLSLSFCSVCGLVQLEHVVSPSLMFAEYPYVSSTTDTFRDHFSQMAEEVTNVCGVGPNSLVVDIGSNDGILLKPFQKLGMRVIGVEPAANIAALARRDGIETVNDFFDKRVVEKIVKTAGQARIVTATNVFTHVDDIFGFVDSVKALLQKDGAFVLEVYYLLSILENMSFDMIYHEHLSYFTATTLNAFFQRAGMKIFRLEKVPTHGGSLRVYVEFPDGPFQTHSSVEESLSSEEKKGASDIHTYRAFAASVMNMKSGLVEFIDNARASGRRIVGYGAPAKATTLLCFCNIGIDKIPYIVDENPLKQGKYLPGVHIPILAPERLDQDTPDYILILAWNFVDEIMRKIRPHRARGTKFLVPIPRLKEVS